MHEFLFIAFQQIRNQQIITQIHDNTFERCIADISTNQLTKHEQHCINSSVQMFVNTQQQIDQIFETIRQKR